MPAAPAAAVQSAPPAPLHALAAQTLNNNSNHRRGINTEEKAKVVDAVWGKELLQFLAVLTIFLFLATILKNSMNLSFSSSHPGATHPIFQIVRVQNS